MAMSGMFIMSTCTTRLFKTDKILINDKPVKFQTNLILCILYIVFIHMQPVFAVSFHIFNDIFRT